MKKYVMAGLGVLFFGVMGSVQAEMEVKVKDNMANNGFSIKEETTGSTITRFRGDGNVGIGTTNPITKLNVAGSVLISGVDNKLIVDGNVTGNQGVILDAANNMGRIVLTGGVGGFIIGRKSESDDVYFSHNYGLELSAGNFRPININSVNVNVGRTEVPTTLQVIGTATVSGNVGIGTTNPTARLEVQNSAKSDLFIWSKQPMAVGNTAELLFSTTNALGLLSNAPRIYSYEEASGTVGPWKMGLRFDTFASLPGPGRTTALAITGDGKVGIGTTNPGRKLTLEDSSYPLLSFGINGIEKGYIGWHYSLNRYQISTPGDLSITAGNAGGEQANVLFINNSGNVGIGTTNPAYKLDVNGTIRGSNVSPSDMRWKEHVKTLDNSLEKVNKLRGVSFEWKDKANGNGTQVGLIAQEVEAVFPEVVSEDNEGYKSVAYDKLVGVLVEAVKEQQRQIEELKAERDVEIVALKASNEALKQEISSIKEFMSTHAQAVTVPASAQMR